MITLKYQLKISGFIYSYECENINEHSKCNMPCILQLWGRAFSHINAVIVISYYEIL